MIGQTISHYRVLRVLGEGGMGVVYEAEDVRLGRHVALKFIVHKALDRPDRVVRFEREARAASVLNHPNICTIHDVGESEGRHFIAMELLEGKNLDTMLTHGPLPIRQLLEIASQIADYSKRSFDQGTKTVQNLLGARSLDKAVEVQTEYARSAYEDYVSHATKLGQLYTDLAKETFKSYQDFASKLTPLR